MKPDDWRKSVRPPAPVAGSGGITADEFATQFKAALSTLTPEQRKRLRFAYDNPEGSRRFLCVWIIPARTDGREPHLSSRRLWAIVTSSGLERKDYGKAPCVGRVPSKLDPDKTLPCGAQIPIDPFDWDQPAKCEACREREGLKDG